jgi:hypothetical protein
MKNLRTLIEDEVAENADDSSDPVFSKIRNHFLKKAGHTCSQLTETNKT